MFKAIIRFDSTEDSYKNGELIDGSGTSWEDGITLRDKVFLRAWICDNTYSKWEDITQEDINEYPTATEYHTNYLADAENNGEASAAQIEQWKAGELRLWNVHCHILVSEVTERKAVL